MTAPVDTNIHRIAGLLPKATVTMVPGASHYTFLDTCFPDVVEHLATICKDNPGVDRDAGACANGPTGDRFLRHCIAREWRVASSSVLKRRKRFKRNLLRRPDG